MKRSDKIITALIATIICSSVIAVATAMAWTLAIIFA